MKINNDMLRQDDKFDIISIICIVGGLISTDAFIKIALLMAGIFWLALMIYVRTHKK